ncbi:hypothetical protein ACFFMP_00225 [Pseudoroseomonas cervicalis]|uniref:hypothetical protein n=1 Tax=Teichococcus cervicalis TaxID=204525 RepID=UPI0035EE1D9E
MARGRSRPPRSPPPARPAAGSRCPRRPPAAAEAAAEAGVSALRVELDRLKRERDEARALLAELLAKQQGEGGAVIARRLAALEEERRWRAAGRWRRRSPAPAPRRR